MRVLAVANQKGGVGKTTTVVNLAAGLARRGQRVLVVDMDAQANATIAMLGGRAEEHMGHVLVGATPLRTIVRSTTTPGVWIAPAGTELAQAELTLATKLGRETKLRNALEGLDSDFDFVLIDTSPLLGLMNVNALVAADHILVPTSPEFFSLVGLDLLSSTIRELHESKLGTAEVLGYVITSYDRRLAISSEVEAQLEKQFGKAMFKTRIRINAALKAAPAHQQDVFQHEAKLPKPRKGTEDFTALTTEFLARVNRSRRA